MMKKIVFLMLVATIIFACEGPKGGHGEDFNLKRKTNTVIGFVELYNNYGLKVSDFSGVKIELKNGDATFNATSDIKGKYKFDNLPIGVYNISFTKDDYAIYKYFSFINIGDTCYPNKRDIFLKTTTIVNKDAVVDTLQTDMLISGTFKPNNKIKQAIAFISNDKNVSPTNYEISNIYFSNDSESNKFFLYIPRNKYESGTTLYVIIYGTTINHTDFYYNKNTNMRVYSNLSESNTGIITVAIP